MVNNKLIIIKVRYHEKFFTYTRRNQQDKGD